ncbi:MAG: glycosyltransferase family 39 protein [Bacteroidota bacterium]
MQNKSTNIAFYCCVLFLMMVTFIKPRYLEQHTNATLAWDVSGYYLYLPALFIYEDLAELEFLPGIIEKYTPSPAADQAYPAANGRMVMKYSAGMAVQYAPAFFIGHLMAQMTGHPADGFSLPYQASVHWWSVFYAVIGLFFLKKILSKYFDGKIVGLVLIGLTFGTNFLNYATFDAANTHAYLFTLVAVLTYSTIRFYETYLWKYAILIGAALGLMALTRPTEIIYAMIPVLWGVASLEDLKNRFSFLLKHFPKILTAVIITGAIGSIQLIYWKTISGNWLEYSYQDQGFSFLRPHFSDVFFSYRKGWLTYTPLMVLALIGFVVWFFDFIKNKELKAASFPDPQPPPEGGNRAPSPPLEGARGREKIRQLFPIVFFFCLINTWIICAWDIWWYGGAFGQRAFIQSYILLAFPMAYLLQRLYFREQLTRPIKLILTVFIAACIALNVFQTYQAHWGPFETEAMTKAYYWRIFGKTKNDPYDRLLLDAKEGFFGERKNVELILKEDFENHSDTIYLSKKNTTSGKWSAFININQEFSAGVNIPKKENLKTGKWLSVNASFYSPKMNWSYWQMPQLVVRFEKNNIPVRERIIRPFRVMVPDQWFPVGMNIKIPKKEFDNIEIFLWNAGGMDVELLMDDLTVEVFSG